MSSQGDRDNVSDLLEQTYDQLEGSEALMDYSKRHGIESAGVLTVYDDEVAAFVAAHLAERIQDRVIVEIGGGIGLLAFHLGQYAKRVYCIEANPMWSWVFATTLLMDKPKNVSYLFGAADEFEGIIHADVALFCTHSGVKSMKEAAALFAPEVIDVYAVLLRNGIDK